jgi:hypothetical protein
MSTVTTNQSTAYNRVPKAVLSEKMSVGGRTKNVKTFVPLHQSKVIRGHKSFHTTSFKGVPQNLFNGTGQRYVGQIQMGSIGLIKSATLKIKMSVQGNAGVDEIKFNDVPHWFDRIEIKAQNGSKPITTLHNDTLLYNFNLVDQPRLRELLISANFQGDTSSNGNAFWSQVTSVTSNGTKAFYLPLLGSIFGHSPVYFGNSTGDMNIELFSSSGFATPYSVTGNPTVTCDSIDLIIESETLSPEDQIFHQNHHQNALSCHRFLEPIENHFFGRTLNDNTEYKFDLDAIIGDVSHLLVGIQDSDSTNGAYTAIGKFYASPVIDKFDILDSSGKSLYGNGQAVDFQMYTSEIHPSNFATNFNTSVATKNWLVIPFSQDLKNAYHGVKDGCMRFDQNRKYVSITTNNEPVQTKTYDVKIYAFVYRKLSSKEGRFIATDDLE